MMSRHGLNVFEEKGYRIGSYGRVFCLWKGPKARKLFDIIGFKVCDFSTSVSKTGSENVWMSYVLDSALLQRISEGGKEGEKIWHESQKSCKLSDGSLELTFRVAGLEEIKRWIMGLGSEAYVEEPKKLRDMIKADLKKAFIQYDETKPTYQELELPKSRVDYV
jgi:hypothetical protein